jgi:hypothetical protein
VFAALPEGGVEGAGGGLVTAPLDLLAALVLDGGARWGDVATGWQRADAAAVLDSSGPRLHYLTRPRGASKTSDTAAIALVLLLTAAPARSRSFAYAVDADQAGILLDALAGFVDRSPVLGSHVKVGADMVTHRRTGATLAVESADAASAFGKLAPYFIALDELAQWPSAIGHRRLWSAIASTLVKPPRPRLVILTTAGDPAHWSRRVLDEARSSPRWRVSEVPGPCPWVEPDDLDEQRRLLLPSEFARLHLNEWAAGEDRLASPSELARCVGHVGPLPPRPRVRYVLALDVGLVADATVLSIAHAEPVESDGRRAVRVVLDRQHVWGGSREAPVDLGEVEAAIVEASRAYNRARLVFDPWQAQHLAQRLRTAGVRADEFTFSSQSVGRLGRTLFGLIRDGLLDLPDEEALLDELAHVRLRETAPGVVRLDHDADRHDDRAVSLALAAHALVERARPRSGRVSSAAEAVSSHEDRLRQARRWYEVPAR